LWQRFLDPQHAAAVRGNPAKQARDKRFKAPQWREEPVFDFLRQSYLVIADHLLKRRRCAWTASIRGRRSRCASPPSGFIDAMSPSNFPATNPEVIEKIDRDEGREPVEGPQPHDGRHGQGPADPDGDPDAFELGRNLATTPGKVVKRTPLYELIQYAPADRREVYDPADHLPALDQPLLHPRSQRPRRASSAGRWSRDSPCSSSRGNRPTRA
jgi:polyhydroxyalkanoate synthase